MGVDKLKTTIFRKASMSLSINKAPRFPLSNAAIGASESCSFAPHSLAHGRLAWSGMEFPASMPSLSKQITHGKVKCLEQGMEFADSHPWLLEDQVQRFPVHDAELLPEDGLSVLRHHLV